MIGKKRPEKDGKQSRARKAFRAHAERLNPSPFVAVLDSRGRPRHKPRHSPLMKV
jgi:hypothetical protein